MDVDGGSGVAREFERQRLHVHTCSAMVSSCYFAWAVSGDQPIAPILVSGWAEWPTGQPVGRAVLGSGPLASQWAGRWPTGQPVGRAVLGSGPLASQWATRFWGVAHWPAGGPLLGAGWRTGQPVRALTGRRITHSDVARLSCQTTL